MFQGKPFQSTAETLTDVVLCTTTRAAITDQMRKFPDVALGMVSFFAHRIGELEKKTLSLGAFSARQRLAAHLLDAQKSESPFGQNGSIGLNLSRQETADTLGMAKETLIRLLTKFNSEGLVTIEGTSIFVRNSCKLSEVLSDNA